MSVICTPTGFRLGNTAGTREFILETHTDLGAAIQALAGYRKGWVR